MKVLVRGCSIAPEAKYYLAKQPSSSYYFNTYAEWLTDFVNNFINFVSVDDKRKE